MTIKVLFVCMGNICRSPTAHGVFEHLLREHGLDHLIEVDSAGTHAYHVGEPPDPRAQETARQRGYELAHQRARRVQEADFLEFDYIVAMDRANYEDLKSIALPGHEERLHLFLDFAPEVSEDEVPDPYYGGPQGFQRVLDMIEEAAQGLLAEIRRRHGL